MRFWVMLAVAGVTQLAAYHLSAQSGLQNLGPHINSEHPESAPLISPYGDQLYFWSIGRPGGHGFQDIYLSRKDEEMVLTAQFVDTLDPAAVANYRKRLKASHYWTPAQNLGPPLSDALANIPLSITPDGKQLLIFRKSNKKGYADLALVRRIDGTWAPPQQLKMEDFSNPGGTSLTAFLAFDGRHLLLSLKTPMQGDNLFISRRKKDGSWSAPFGLTSLNTDGDEITPFLAPDGRTLYFASDGYGDAQGLDIYFARRKGEGWTAWSTPKRLPDGVNTPGDEYYFKYPLDAEYAYLTTDLRSGQRDLYRVKLPRAYGPLPVMEVSGKLVEAGTGEPLGATIEVTRLPEGELVGSVTTDPSTGTFKLLLPGDQEYGIVAVKENYLGQSILATPDTLQRVNRIYETLYLTPVNKGAVLPVGNLFFKTGSAELDPKSLPELRRLALVLKEYPNYQLEIAGHTDNIGQQERNQELSEARARAVAESLQSYGLPGNRMQVKGYGETQPVADNATSAGRAKNRRVEIRLQ